MATQGKYLFSEAAGGADTADFDKSEVESSIAHRFSMQAARSPEAFAVRDASHIISYGRLDALSNAIAHRLLHELGPDPARVALHFPLSADAVAAHLGVWKAGKTCVPLDPACPPARTASILADSGTELLITANGQLDGAPGPNIVSRVLETGTAAEGMPKDAPRVSVNPGDPAAIIYISDSSAAPRGIVQTHRSLLHRSWSDAQYFPISEHDRVSQLASPGFGAGIPQMLAALLNGASLHPFDLQQRSFVELYEWLWSERITLFCPSVSVFRQFLESCPAGERYDDCRFVVQSGGPTLATTVDAWREHFPPDGTLVCQLTSTEAQVISRFSISRHQHFTERYVPTGYADCDKQLAVVDSGGVPVERGEIGELVVSSRYLAAGTWSREHQAVTGWIDAANMHDLSSVTSFRTNDLVSFDARGRLRHHGRSDSAIKLRGYRIDTAEVEKALLELEGIREAVCVTRELENNRRQLVAFYVLADSGNKPLDEDLRRSLRSRIPNYMIPARFIAVTELPRTINGKIARRAVENLEIVQRSRGPELHTYENELQRRFVEIWREAIGHEDIGIDDDFFDIGGDSLSALQVCAALSRSTGKEVPLSMLIQLRNIRQLVARLDRTEEPITCVSLQSRSPTRQPRRPLFCIEGVYLYKQLAEALGPEIETIGVIARPETHLLMTCSAAGRRHGQPAGAWPPSVEQIAATYIEQIRRFQRTAPWQLAGAGFGGVLAFEMARQLSAAGEHVSVLAMLDSIAPQAVVPYSLRGWLTLAAKWISHSIPMGVPDPRADSQSQRSHIEQSQAVALMRYKPAPWHGNAILFEAEEENGAGGLRVLPHRGWRRLVAGQLTSQTIHSTWPGMLSAPYALEIARTLRPFLANRSAPTISAS